MSPLMLIPFLLAGDYMSMMTADLAWDLAFAANQKEEWYLIQTPQGGYIYHKYKPAIADLLSKRLGINMVKEGRFVDKFQRNR